MAFDILVGYLLSKKFYRGYNRILLLDHLVSSHENYYKRNYNRAMKKAQTVNIFDYTNQAVVLQALSSAVDINLGMTLEVSQ
jgi:hypothetical protein